MKISKSKAQYEPKSTHRAERCSGCSMFREPNGCTAVHGEINPKGWCKLWEPKKND